MQVLTLCMAHMLRAEFRLSVSPPSAYEGPQASRPCWLCGCVKPLSGFMVYISQPQRWLLPMCSLTTTFPAALHMPVCLSMASAHALNTWSTMWRSQPTATHIFTKCTHAHQPCNCPTLRLRSLRKACAHPVTLCLFFQSATRPNRTQNSSAPSTSPTCARPPPPSHLTASSHAALAEHAMRHKGRVLHCQCQHHSDRAGTPPSTWASQPLMCHH